MENEEKLKDENPTTDKKKSVKSVKTDEPPVTKKEPEPIKISLREFCNSLGTVGINKFASATLAEYENDSKTREEWESLRLRLIQ